MNTIELVKKADIFGVAPVGASFIWTYKTLPYAQARGQALRAFKRDNPEENPMEWEEVQASDRDLP